MKRSPYFFLRRQAEKRLQTYSFSSFGLILATLFIGTYAWQTPQDTTARSALLTNAKPPKPEVTEVVALAEANKAPATENTEITDDAQALALSESSLFLRTGTAVVESEPELPTEFDQFESSVPLNDNTDLGTLLFSTDVTTQYEAINPRRFFPEGYFTIYATFTYEAMADGMEWAWVWRRDGDVVGGGNELWAYGEDGPGYVYLNPEEGFQPGEYSVEVWVNDELLTTSSIVVNNAAVSAGN